MAWFVEKAQIEPNKTRPKNKKRGLVDGEAIVLRNGGIKRLCRFHYKPLKKECEQKMSLEGFFRKHLFGDCFWEKKKNLKERGK